MAVQTDYIVAARRKSKHAIAGPNLAAKIRAVTLGSNFTARISCQVSFCRRKISGLELVFSVVDLDFKAVDQLISVKLCVSNLHRDPWHGVVYENIQL